MVLKTSLYDTHLKYQGKMVEFAGYMLPIQYSTGVIEEHMTVRQKCGLFDVSHMGEVMLTGSESLQYLNYLLSNDFTNMVDGQARYSLMMNDEGGIVDDLIVYKINENNYFIVVNASNRHKDLKWMKSKAKFDINLEDISDNVGQLALQGPLAHKILLKICSEEMLPEKYYTANLHAMIAGKPCIVSKTGYTGENGYEIYCDQKDAPEIWETLMDAGKEDGLIACGLGARDTLRLEAAMPLYGHEMNDEITPLEANLKMFVKMDKEDFVGKQALINKGEITKKRVGLKVVGRGIIRENVVLYKDEKQVGVTTSGTHCPYLGYPVAMAIVDVDFAEIDSILVADVRGRKIEAQVVALPFYKKKKI